MPRVTVHKRVLASLSLLLEERQKVAQKRFLLNAMEDEDKDYSDRSESDDDSSIEGIIDAAVVSIEKTIRSQRYFFPRDKYRLKKKASFDLFERDLSLDREEDGTPPWLSDIEFLEKYRIQRDIVPPFHRVVTRTC